MPILGTTTINFLLTFNWEGAMFKCLLGISLAGALMSGAAVAADMTAPVAYDWSGFYLGAQVGADIFSVQNFGSATLPSSTGLMGGVNAEILRQTDKLVFGLVADGNYSLNNASSFCTTTHNNTCSVSRSWNASVRGKLGFAADRALIYGTGGWGWADFHKTSTTGNTVNRTLNGWVAGVGIDYAIDPKWALNLEYLHYDLGSGTPFIAVKGMAVAPTMDTVSLGISYKF